jgi:hypothetical protein
MTQKKNSLSNIEPHEGKYVNYFKVGYNADVFVIDHYQFFPETDDEEADIKSLDGPKYRIITSPANAKQLLAHLKTSLVNFEKNYGTISIDTDFENNHGTI